MRHAWALPAMILFVASSCSDSATMTQSAEPAAAVEVGVLSMQATSVPRYVELPGRVVANATAEIRPQVDGIVEKRLFQEGGPIKAGDPLYVLNDDKFRAALDAAAAALQKTKATVAGAQLTYDRDKQLQLTKAASQADLDTAETALLQAKADQAAAQADLETAQINFDDTRINAPIGGIISTSSVSVGALVTANQTDAMATIRQIDPVLVDLVDTSVNMLQIRDEIRNGTIGQPGKDGPPKVALTLENGKTYDKQGEISLANIVVSETTGTFSLRAVFANPDRLLLPGMFVRARIDLGTMPNTYRVPQLAVSHDTTGQAQAYFVGAENKAELRTLTTAGTLGTDWLVSKGIKDGDQLIVDGFQRIGDGSSVKPVAATINDAGVVVQTASAKAQPDAAKTETAK
jgi:membrane fusion protein (multidrug efflux system)